MHGIYTVRAYYICARLLEVAGLEDGEELRRVCPRAAQQLGSQVVAHARDVELLLDGLAQACERICMRGKGVPGVAERARLRVRARTVLRDSHGHLGLLARLASRHVRLQERLPRGGWGRVHIPWGV
eukprot:scaffold73056_cov60-Phaeocystis_antarctica.AAC.2